MKKGVFIGLLIGFILILAVFTNPNEDRHKEVIRGKLTAFMQKSMQKNRSTAKDGWEQAGQALGLMLSGAVIDGLVNNMITTENYVLFSVTKVTWEGKSKVFGIGLFGNVFLSSKLEESLEDSLAK